MKEETLLALLRGPSEFSREGMQPIEEMGLAGRSLTVTGEMLGGIAHGNGVRPVSGMVKALTLGGRLLVGVARILVPGGIEGTLYRHWLTLAVLLDGLLLLLATFSGDFTRPALVLTAYTGVIAGVVEAARYVARNGGDATRRLKTVGVVALAFAGVFLAFYFLGDAIIQIPFGHPDLSNRAYVRAHPQTANVLAFTERVAVDHTRLTNFALGAALLLWIAAAWARVTTFARRSRPGAALWATFATLLPGLVCGVAAWVVVRLLPGNERLWHQFAVFAAVVGVLLGAVSFAVGRGNERPNV